MNSVSQRISLILQRLAKEIDAALEHEAGERCSWVLIINADDIAQYVSNTTRTDGVMLIEKLLDRWKTGRADIPAHYNPDLRTEGK
jgi:hypothetical protein